MESLFSFLASRSSAICRPIAFISFLLRAEVMYICISKKRPEHKQDQRRLAQTHSKGEVYTSLT